MTAHLLGVDFGTSGVRVGVFDEAGAPVAFHSEDIVTTYPRSGWAEQDPAQWWTAFVTACRGALAASGLEPDDIAGIGSDATASTVLAIGADDEPLGPAILWMDVRAADQATRLAATGDQALKYCGFGDVSAEWGLPKALWLKEQRPDVWDATTHLVDCNDWFVHRLTGEWASSVTIASAKYLYDRDTGGAPRSLLDGVGFADFLTKAPEAILDVGERVGGLRADVADELGLRAGTPVGMGGIDAYSGALGLGVVEPGTMALITGSSHVMISQSATPLHGRGIWGAYTDALVPGQYTIEAGQASTGSVVSWFKNNFASEAALRARDEHRDPYDVLTEQARAIGIGSDGLVWLDTFQGNRSPYTDPLLRGAAWGLGLGHSPAHVFRAILESICFGTELILKTMRGLGHDPERIVIAGGPSRNDLWLQMHADVSNRPISLTACADGPALGSAMVAGVASGVHESLAEAASAMVHVTRTIEPDADAHERYRPYQELYEATYAALTPLMHRMSAVREES